MNRRQMMKSIFSALALPGVCSSLCRQCFGYGYSGPRIRDNGLSYRLARRGR